MPYLGPALGVVGSCFGPMSNRQAENTEDKGCPTQSQKMGGGDKLQLVSVGPATHTMKPLIQAKR